MKTQVQNQCLLGSSTVLACWLHPPQGHFGSYCVALQANASRFLVSVKDGGEEEDVAQLDIWARQGQGA